MCRKKWASMHATRQKSSTPMEAQRTSVHPVSSLSLVGLRSIHWGRNWCPAKGLFRDQENELRSEQFRHRRPPPWDQYQPNVAYLDQLDWHNWNWHCFLEAQKADQWRIVCAPCIVAPIVSIVEPSELGHAAWVASTPQMLSVWLRPGDFYIVARQTRDCSLSYLISAFLSFDLPWLSSFQGCQQCAWLQYVRLRENCTVSRHCISTRTTTIPFERSLVEKRRNDCF